MSSISATRIKDTIRNVPDFPKQGILFRDITPVLKDSSLFQETLDWFEAQLRGTGVQYVIGIESRGFILAAALAERLKIGFVPARKMGKLPGLVERHKYDLEYGSDCIEMHVDAFPPGSKVAIVDDLLATGGTAMATISLAQKLQGEIIALLFMIELAAIEGRKALPAEILTQAMIIYNY